MYRLLGAAALALVATNPALAQEKGGDNPGKGGGKPDHAAMNHASPGEAKGRGNGKGKDRGEDRSESRDGDRGKQPKFDDLRHGAEQAFRGGDDTRRGGAGRAEARNEIRGARAAVAERIDYRDGRRDRGDWDDGGRRWVERDRFYADVPSCPPGLAKKNNGCLPPGLARQARDETFGYAYRPALFGIPLQAAADYVYYDGYLIPSGGGGGHFLPLLGGALAVGQVWPDAYPSLRLSDWQQDYYGFEEPDGYRYADNVLYDVDPGTSAIESIVALLTGSDFAVGERLPEGYDVYNVPAAYQNEYYDSDEAMYRYADGQVLQVDPTTMLIEQIIELIA